MSKSPLVAGVFRLIVLAGFGLVLALNLPGHLTWDSVAQLHEGRVGVRETWGPAFYAWLLGTGDRIATGTSVYVVVTSLVLFASLASLPSLRARVSWWGPLAAAAMIATPHVLIGQAIVWKDIAFSNAAVASMIWLAHADFRWDDRRRRWLCLALSLALMAIAAQLRQNGAIVALAAAVATGWIASRGRLRRGVVWAAGAVAAFLVTNQSIGALSLASLRPNPAVPAGSGVGLGVRLIQAYDLAGAVTRDPNYRLTIIARQRPQAAQVVQMRAPRAYSTQRIDFLDNDAAFSAAMVTIPTEAIRDQWLNLVTTRPDLYLWVRLGVFRWLVAPPLIDRCGPIAIGVDPNPTLATMGMVPRRSAQDQRLYNYTTYFLDTPVYSHVTYGLVALTLAGVLLWRRRSADVPIAFLQLGALAFTACFFVISIACDWRYLYFLDLAAMVGVVYLAVDPRIQPGRSAPHDG